MNKQRIRRCLANLLVFLSTLSSAWLSTPVEQTIASTAPYAHTEEPNIPSRFQRLGQLPMGDVWRHLQFISEHEGWYSDSEHLWHTSDGGKTWHLLASLGHELRGNINGFHFASSQLGWMVQPNELYRTKNGGATWEHIRTPVSDGAGSCNDCYLAIQQQFRRVLFRDVDNGLALDGHGFLYESTDAGTSWHRLDISITFASIGFLNDTNAWVVSEENELVRVSLAPRR